MKVPIDNRKPILEAERKALDELYSIQINSVRTLAKLLGYPCPIVDRRDRPRQDVPDIDACAILDRNK